MTMDYKQIAKVRIINGLSESMLCEKSRKSGVIILNNLRFP